MYTQEQMKKLHPTTTPTPAPAMINFTAPENIPDSVNYFPLRASAVGMGRISTKSDNKTFRSIAIELNRGKKAVLAYLRMFGPDNVDEFIDTLFVPQFDGVTEYPPIIGTLAGDVFASAREKYLFPEFVRMKYNPTTGKKDIPEHYTLTPEQGAFKGMNDYIWKQRTNNAKEVLTPYTWEQIEQASEEEQNNPENSEYIIRDIFACTDETWKKTVRVIFDGLTQREQEQGRKDTADKSAVISATREVSAEFTPAQKKIADCLANGMGIHATANKCYPLSPAQIAKGKKRSDTKTTKEHIKFIRKKLSANSVIKEYTAQKGIDTTIVKLNIFTSFTQYRKQREQMYNKLFCAIPCHEYPVVIPAPAQPRSIPVHIIPAHITTPAPIPAPVHQRAYFDEHCTGGVKYLLTPHSEYRKQREQMYNKLFAPAPATITPAQQERNYHEYRQGVYNILFHAVEYITAPVPAPIILPQGKTAENSGHLYYDAETEWYIVKEGTTPEKATDK